MHSPEKLCCRKCNNIGGYEEMLEGRAPKSVLLFVCKNFYWCSVKLFQSLT